MSVYLNFFLGYRFRRVETLFLFFFLFILFSEAEQFIVSNVNGLNLSRQ